LRIEIDTSLTSLQVVRALDELAKLRGAPQSLCPDNGQEFISIALRQCAERHDTELLHIQLGKPTQNTYIEGFNRGFRTEVLERNAFTSLHGVRCTTEDCRHPCSHQRPHRSLGGPLPVAYAMASSTTSTSGRLGERGRLTPN
jgi:putative transposase